MDDPVNKSALQYADPPVAWSVPGDPAAWIVAADKPVRVLGGVAVAPAAAEVPALTEASLLHMLEMIRGLPVYNPLDRVIGDLAADHIGEADRSRLAAALDGASKRADGNEASGRITRGDGAVCIGHVAP